ncbi:MAG: hypothetical protein ACRD16_09675 [Thermoanaerobaculia bacterium]
MSSRPSGSRPRWESPAAGVFFALATIAMTWPLVTDLRHLLADPGDPYLVTWILHWDWKQFFRDPVHLFDANIFYPARLTLAFSENLFGVSLLGFPLFFAGVAPVAVYNILFLLGMALSGFGAWALARELTGDAGAALAAGVFYEFVPFRFDQVSHLQMQWGGFLPLFLLFLWRFFHSGRRRDLAGFAVFFSWNALACVHFGIFGGLSLALLLVFLVAAGPPRPSLRLLPGVGWALAACAVVLLPFYLPYVEASKLYHFHRSFEETKFFSAAPENFLSAGAHNRLYAALTARFQAPERQMFPGLVVPALSAFAAILWVRRAWKRSRDPSEKRAEAPLRNSLAVRALDVLLATLLLLGVLVAIRGGISLGRVFRVHKTERLFLAFLLAGLARLSLKFPFTKRYSNLRDFLRNGVVPTRVWWAASMVGLGCAVALGVRFVFYRALLEAFPFVLRSIRAPARGIVIAHVGFAVLAAEGISQLRNRARRSWRPALLGGILGVLFFELRAAPVAWARLDTDPKPVDRWLEQTRFPGGVLELPMSNELDTDYLYHTVFHDHPILNGASGFFPETYLTLKQSFDEKPILPHAFDLARSLQARVVIFHSGLAGVDELGRISASLKAETLGGEIRPLALLRAGGGRDLVYEITSPLAGARSAALSAEPRAAAAFDSYLAHPDPPALPPYGWYDGPDNGAILTGSEIRGSGWAASDSGLGRVELRLDHRPVGTAAYGFPRPDVLAAKPGVPCGGACGYRYRIVNVPRGRHILTTTFVGNNGRAVELPSVEIWVLARGQR